MESDKDSVREILVVEDDERILNILKRGLEADDFSVDCVMGKPAALKALKGKNYDAIILDVFLGPDNGLEICRTLRNDQNGTPVLVISAMGSPDMRYRSFMAGADAFLAKPFAFDTLVSHIQDVIRMNREEASGNV